jgi:hypothetical protein
VVSADFTFTTTDSSDVTAPVISLNADSHTILDTLVVLNWDTNELSKSEIRYGLDADELDVLVTNNNFNINHAITLSNLSPETTYYYEITAIDTNDLNSSETGSFTTSELLIIESEVERREELARESAEQNTNPPTSSGGGVLIIDKTDKVAPLISNIRVDNISYNEAEIKWQTNELADSYVDYGLSVDYQLTAGSRTQVSEHGVLLKDLEENTYYHYRISSVDASGNYSESEDLFFITLSLDQELEDRIEENIEEIVEGGDDSTGAEQLDTAQNLFELATQAVQRAVGVIRSSASKLSLNFMESSLLDQQTSIDELAGFLPVPVMSGDPAVMVTDTTASISWRTDKEASSVVSFVPMDLYDESLANPYTQSAGDTAANTLNHQVVLNGLQPNTTYYYQLESKAALGAPAKSDRFVFRTEAESLGIQKYLVNNISDEQVSFQWVTSADTDSKVEYIPYKDEALDMTQARQKYDDYFTTIHNIMLDDLSAGVEYRVILSSQNKAGVSVQQVIDNFSTSDVDSSPFIDQVQTISAISPGKNLKIQTVISWLTNEPSTTRVYYKKGVAKEGEILPESTQLDENYTKKHVAVITKFDPGAVYSFQTESIDYSGKVSLSKIYTILTPRQEESVFQVIVKNLEGMFGWVKQMK